MADAKISALAEITTPTASDVMPIVNGGATKKVQLTNLVNAVAAIGARVYSSTPQAITTGVSTAIAFNSERFDTDTIHDTVTNNSRLTCKTAGVYLITGSIEWEMSTGARSLAVRFNGTTTIVQALVPAVSGNLTMQTCSTIYQFAINDYVELMVAQDSGNNLNVNATASYSPEFGMVRLGA